MEDTRVIDIKHSHSFIKALQRQKNKQRGNRKSRGSVSRLLPSRGCSLRALCNSARTRTIEHLEYTDPAAVGSKDCNLQSVPKGNLSFVFIRARAKSTVLTGHFVIPQVRMP
jgi:hypothetical protein